MKTLNLEPRTSNLELRNQTPRAASPANPRSRFKVQGSTVQGFLLLLLSAFSLQPSAFAASPSFQQTTNIARAKAIEVTNNASGAVLFGQIVASGIVVTNHARVSGTLFANAGFLTNSLIVVGTVNISSTLDTAGAGTFRTTVRADSLLSSNNLTVLGTNFYLGALGQIQYSAVNGITISNNTGIGFGVPLLDIFNVAGGVANRGARIATMYIGEYSSAPGSYATFCHTNMKASLANFYAMLQDSAGSTAFNGSAIQFNVGNTNIGYMTGRGIGFGLGTFPTAYFNVDFSLPVRYRGVAYWGGATGATNAMQNYSTVFNTLDISRFDLTNRLMGAVYGNASQVVATNSAAVVQLLGDTSVGTTNIAASTYTAGKRMMFDAAGIYTTSVAGPTITLELVYNGTVIATSGAITPTSSVTDKGWHCVGSFTVHTTGASGTAFADGELILKNTGVIGSEIVADMSSSNAAFTIATTAAAKIELRATWSANTAGNMFNCRQASFWHVN